MISRENWIGLETFPSPMIVEGSDHANFIAELNLRALCTLRNPGEAACGKCPSCIKIAKGFHPDLISMSEYSMESIRDVLTQLYRKPFESKFKVLSLIHFEASGLTVQNALLKTLEEPSIHWKIWMGTTSKYALLGTIRSRCLSLKLPPIQPESLKTDEEEAFEFISQRDEFQISSSLEGILKDRAKAHHVFLKFLNYAASKRYPGHWRWVAPEMESALFDLRRNLNPKIVWESLWSKSIYNFDAQKNSGAIARPETQRTFVS